MPSNDRLRAPFPCTQPYWLSDTSFHGRPDYGGYFSGGDTNRNGANMQLLRVGSAGLSNDPNRITSDLQAGARAAIQTGPEQTHTLHVCSILGHTGSYWAILGHTRRYWALLEYTGPYLIILDHTGAYWRILGSTGPTWRPALLTSGHHTSWKAPTRENTSHLSLAHLTLGSLQVEVQRD